MVEHGGGWEAGDGWPSEDKMTKEIRDLLANADLNTITKKSVRKTLEEKYGTTLQGDRKEWVNKEVERALGA
ncbi:hypothetical protein BT69DRAFT_1289999 [Atractiella rhizophila]|nr:hypothetical protein BT69DRAFT_1289999 [Atractiella rhizophila]